MLNLFESPASEEESMGFIKVATATPIITVANCQKNAEQIIEMMRHASDEGASIVALPELCITGYTAADLFSQPFLLREAILALENILSMTSTVPIVAVLGMPLALDGRLYNCAVVISKGDIIGVVPKTYIPNYGEFYEARWFTSGVNAKAKVINIAGAEIPFGTDLLFSCDSNNLKFGIEICEDVWAPNPPSTNMALQGAQLLINISASNESVGKNSYRTQILKTQSAKTISAYVYVSSGKGESTTDLVFGGASFIFENGTLLACGERFSQDPQITSADIDLLKLDALRLHTSTFYEANACDRPVRIIPLQLRKDAEDITVTRTFDPHPFIPSDLSVRTDTCSEIFNIQTNGLAQRMVASHSKKAVIGVSGGLDSTLALLVAAKTMDLLQRPRTDVVGITMPGFGTTSRTYNNALGLMKSLGITIEEIDITKACKQHLQDIGVSENDRSVTFENTQARERTQILMDYANKINGLVVGTGDLSELALGWATYNGDQMSMYGVNASVPKTLVKYIVDYVADTIVSQDAKSFLKDIIDTPISPELLPANDNGEIQQKTEDLVGPYELHDFFIYNFMRFGFSPARLFMMAKSAFYGVYNEDFIKKWLTVFLRRFFNQQFKRSAMPDGPKVGSITLSPRGDWRMPSDATADMWLNEANDL